MNHGRPEFLRVTLTKEGLRKRTLINKYPELIYKLAHKAFLEKKLRRLEMNILSCEKVLRHWQLTDGQSIFLAMPKYFDLLDLNAVADTSKLSGDLARPHPVNDGSVAPIDAALNIGAMDIDEWAAKPYCSNTKYEECKIHRTSNGIDLELAEMQLRKCIEG